MSNQPINDADLLKIIQSEREKYEHISEVERQTLIEQRVRELLEQERAEERQENEQAADIVSAELAYDPAKERDRARETAKSAALLLIMLLLILLLIAAATGRTDILPIPGVQANQTLRPYLSTATGEFKTTGFFPTPAPGPPPAVDAFFAAKYQEILAHGSECSIGNPISPAYSSQGLRYQWFQRAVLKEMPAGFVDDPSWAIQGELLGREVTTAIPFPTTSPFLSQPEAHNFQETGYSVSGRFLDFWVKCDGLHVLGYPISDPVYEVLTPGQQPSQVQYFERGRLEYHQEDPNQQVQFGLLALIKSKDEHFKPNIVMPPQAGPPVVPATATPVPVVPATATAPPAGTTLPLPTSTATAIPAATGYPAP